ncbi:MAG: hypothetical protein MUF18_05075 [Fimbriiglobus sp.]|nr:hypothetical protein [Fimbriiglobus sp.]
MLRGLLFAFALLSAALPAGVCVCELLHLQHDHTADAPDDHNDCPCHCGMHPREATAPEIAVLSDDGGLRMVYFSAPYESSPGAPAVPLHSESPPGSHPSRPLYLVTARLLI